MREEGPEGETMNGDGFYLNPKNADVLRSIVAERGPLDPPPTPFADRLYSFPVYFSDAVPERNLHEQWCPPECDRFCDYGPEDETWMRPLGLGTIKTIDMGPLVLRIQERMRTRIDELMFSGPPTFECNSFSTQVRQMIISGGA